MNPKTLFVVLASSLPVTATPLIWDSDGTTGAPSGGTGTWDTTSLLWDNAGTMQTWNSGATDTAIFGGTAGTVSLAAGGVTANGLQFDTTDYIIQSNTLTLAGATPTITTATGVTATITSTVTGTAGLVKTGEGTLLLNGAGNTLTGGVIVNGGVFAVDGNQPGNRLPANSLVTINSTGVFEVRGVNALPSGTNALDIAVNAGGTLRVVSGGSAAVGAGGQSHLHLRNLTLSGGTIQLTYSGAGSAYSGESFQLNGDVTVNGTATSTITTVAAAVNQGIALNGTRTFTVNDVTASTASDLTVSAELENTDTPAGALIKAGTGTMTLAASNSYTGATTINAGTLQANAVGSLNGTSSITVNTGATLETNGTNLFVGGHGTALADTKVVTLNNATWVMTAAHDARIGNVTLNNGSTWTSNRGLGNFDALLANTTAGAATVTVTGNAASTMNGTGGIHLQGVQNFNIADVTNSAAADLTVSMQLDNAGSIGGAAGGINKLGAGTMALSRQATYTGGTTINGGVLDLTGGGGSGGTIRGTVTINNTGVLRLSSNDVTGYGTGEDRVDTIHINEGGNLDVNTISNQTLGSATINMTGSTITGIASSNLDFFAGASALNTLASANSATISGVKLNLRQNGGVTFTVANGAAAQDLVINSVISNSESFTDNNLIKAGAGTMVINSVSTYTTQTRVQEGTLALGANGSISTSSSINLAVSTTLDVAGVNGGWSLASGQSLTGNGTVNGNASLAGTLAIGNSVGQMNFSQNLTLLGISNFELDAALITADLANVTGVLNFGGTLNVTNLGGTFAGGQVYNLFDFASSSGTFTTINLPNLDTLNTGLSWNTSNLYTNGTLTVVPEPSALALTGLSTLLLFRRRRTETH